MPSPADLNLQGDALVALLDGVHPDATIAARGEPDCMISILVRPLAGEGAAPNSGGCVCDTRWGVYVIASLDCGLDEAQRAVYELVSNCGERSIPARLKPNRKTPTPLYVTEDDEPVRLGAAVYAVEPATSFGLTQYKTDGPANAYAAVVPAVVRYDCC
jgi:hypothetical protein